MLSREGDVGAWVRASTFCQNKHLEVHREVKAKERLTDHSSTQLYANKRTVTLCSSPEFTQTWLDFSGIGIWPGDTA